MDLYDQYYWCTSLQMLPCTVTIKILQDPESFDTRTYAGHVYVCAPILKVLRYISFPEQSKTMEYTNPMRAITTLVEGWIYQNKSIAYIDLTLQVHYQWGKSVLQKCFVEVCIILFYSTLFWLLFVYLLTFKTRGISWLKVQISFSLA